MELDTARVLALVFIVGVTLYCSHAWAWHRGNRRAHHYHATIEQRRMNNLSASLKARTDAAYLTGRADAWKEMVGKMDFLITAETETFVTEEQTEKLFGMLNGEIDEDDEDSLLSRHEGTEN